MFWQIMTLCALAEAEQTRNELEKHKKKHRKKHKKKKKSKKKGDNK